MLVECLDKRFSTTRRLIRDSVEHSFDGSPRFDAPTSQMGGLRTKGLIKTKTDIPLITVITVVFNGESVLEETIKSVISQTYDNIEYIVVDGGSTDNTIDVIRRYEHAIDLWISGPDRGIYDAMNKGIRASSGYWLNFMNASDVFYAETTIAALIERYILPREEQQQFFYSDVVLAQTMSNGKKRLKTHKCDHNRKIINHQASVYSRALHETHGMYLVSKGVTISDYLFFSLVDPTCFLKVERPIAQYDVTGISQSRASVEQKFIIDFLINDYSRGKFVLYFLFYIHIRRAKSFLESCRGVYVQGVSSFKLLFKRRFG